jgi:hypothetical protein
MLSGTLIIYLPLCTWLSLFMANVCTLFMSGTEKRWDIYVSVFQLCYRNRGFLILLYFSFDADMDVSCSACVLVCRGEDSKVLQIWQLFCPPLEGLSKSIRSFSHWFFVPCTNPVPFIFRWPFILAMFCRCKCPNLPHFVTRAGNTCLFSVQRCHLLNGIVTLVSQSLLNCVC